jgi:hypothetical protein
MQIGETGQYRPQFGQMTGRIPPGRRLPHEAD